MTRGIMPFLLTRSGTVLYADPESGALRHAPPDRVPRTLVFRPSEAPQAGRLCLLDEAGAETGRGRDVVWQPLPDGRIGLHSGGSTAAALADIGAIDAFWPLTAAQLDGLVFLLRHRWVSQSLSHVRPQPCAVLLGGEGLVIGTASYPMSAVLGALEQVIERRSFTLAYGAWRVERFALYHPLVYFAAFGSDPVFDCLTLAITALVEFGGWEGDILVLTDAAHADLAQRFDEPVRGRVRTQLVACEDVLDYTLARYHVPAVAGIECYQPILYLDSDVICDRPIDPAMLALLPMPGLSFVAEHALAINGHWYGAALLLDDGYVPAPEEPGFSTGIMGFSDARPMRAPFARIVASCRGYAQACGDRHRFDTYDQPFANYVLRKSGGFGTAILTPLSAIFEPSTAVEATTPRGFAHFAGGVGAAVSKRQRMQDYVAHLRRHA